MTSSTVRRWRILVDISLVGLFLSLHPAFCNSEKAPNYSFMQDATSAPSISYYDYIIVGGGTAGCPLAATLSRNATVLVLERGGSPYDNPNITRLTGYGNALIDHSSTSPFQRFISEDGVINARARVLGGGSAINFGFFTRAPTDYVRDAGWDERLVNESYRWAEKRVAFEPQLGEWQSAVRDGLVEVGVVPYNGFTFDHVYGTKVGGTIFDPKGQRHTAADLLHYADPKRLTVLLHASVHKLVFATRGKEKPLAHGVVFRDASGVKHRAYLKKGYKNEIVLSCGAIGTPQLLMLSGVGPADHLKVHNITLVLDQPLVGQGMSDNPMNGIAVFSPVPTDVSLIEVVGITEFGSYIEASSGLPFTSILSRYSDIISPKINELFKLPLNQRREEAINNSITKEEVEADSYAGFIIEKIIGPLSTGHMKLRNKNPNDNPSVTFNYFKEPKDLERCVRGIETIQKVIESKSFSKFRYDDVSLEDLRKLTAQLVTNLLPKHENTSKSLEQFCKDTVLTIWHYHGGCHVDKVVDRDYKVMGVDGLRVIDASTFDSSPGTNPQATLMMLGRYMGVKILKERLED